MRLSFILKAWSCRLKNYWSLCVLMFASSASISRKSHIHEWISKWFYFYYCL